MPESDTDFVVGHLNTYLHQAKVAVIDVSIWTHTHTHTHKHIPYTYTHEGWKTEECTNRYKRTFEEHSLVCYRCEGAAIY